MYPYALPHKITNQFGEELTFLSLETENGLSKMLVEGRVKPGCGPALHVHYKQDEALTVVQGKMGYVLDGEPERFLNIGETVLFSKGQMHRFWNAGEEDLLIKGWLKPANTTDYFLSKLYSSMDKAGKPEGDAFDSAFLITHYKSEYDVAVIPGFVKKVIMPIMVFFGKLLGKYRHFADAPDPV